MSIRMLAADREFSLFSLANRPQERGDELTDSALEIFKQASAYSRVCVPPSLTSEPQLRRAALGSTSPMGAANPCVSHLAVGPPNSSSVSKANLSSAVCGYFGVCGVGSGEAR